jgi:hypothetical protein
LARWSDTVAARMSARASPPSCRVRGFAGTSSPETHLPASVRGSSTL